MAGQLNAVGEGTRLVAQRMGEAAANFLASLSPDQKAKATYSLTDEERRTFWAYTPIPRDGLPLTEMDRTQQQLAQKLVASGLSEGAFGIASVVMGIEVTLDMREQWTRPLPGRDSRLYYVRIFGEPSDNAPWGWSFEGHHISLNYTIAEGKIVAPTPTFFGANPADSPLGSAMLRPLQGVEDLARQLMHMLDEHQRAHALIATFAPPDIVTTNKPYMTEGDLLIDQQAIDDWRAHEQVHDHELAKLRYTSTPQGLASSALSGGQQELLLALVGEYVHRLPDELAEFEMKKLQAAGTTPLHFAWAGGIERGQGHYYRIQGDSFLAEYDNTQNNANHIHSVWRDPRTDFGKDILAQHYAHSHHH